MNTSELAGQTVIVTGGGRGIGRVIAQELARRDARVAVIARSEVQLNETVALIKSEGGQAHAWVCDVTNGAQVAATVDAVSKMYSTVNVLINNAGQVATMGPLWQGDPDRWWSDVETNLRGPFLFSHAVLPDMIKYDSGRIINIGSNIAIRPAPFAESYGVAKAGLLRLTDSLAAALQGRNIQVFAISPGWVWTAMTDQVHQFLQESMPEFEGIKDEDIFPAQAAADLIVRLLSGEADVLNGRYIHVADDLDRMIKDGNDIVARDLYTLRLRGVE